MLRLRAARDDSFRSNFRPAWRVGLTAVSAERRRQEPSMSTSARNRATKSLPHALVVVLAAFAVLAWGVPSSFGREPSAVSAPRDATGLRASPIYVVPSSVNDGAPTARPEGSVWGPMPRASGGWLDPGYGVLLAVLTGAAGYAVLRQRRRREEERQFIERLESTRAELLALGHEIRLLRPQLWNGDAHSLARRDLTRALGSQRIATDALQSARRLDDLARPRAALSRGRLAMDRAEARLEQEQTAVVRRPQRRRVLANM
jgi:hypothetical protein